MLTRRRVNSAELLKILIVSHWTLQFLLCSVLFEIWAELCVSAVALVYWRPLDCFLLFFSTLPIIEYFNYYQAVPFSLVSFDQRSQFIPRVFGCQKHVNQALSITLKTLIFLPNVLVVFGFKWVILFLILLFIERMPLLCNPYAVVLV